jgi:dihydroorotate dehydrogenase
MSGKPLMPLSLRCVEEVLALAEGAEGRERLTVIGGGGITTPADIDAYALAGVTHVAIGTRVMHPKYLWSDVGVRPLIEHAERRLGG